MTRGQHLLRRRLEQAGMSQAALADELGIRPQSVSLWLAGTAKPRRRLAVWLDERFGIPVGAWDEQAPESEVADG